MSDYEDDEASYLEETDTEAEINEDEAWIGNEANGHGLKDEEDVVEEKMEEENYGEEEPVEHEDDGLRADVDDLMDEETETVEDKKDTKNVVVAPSKRKTSPVMSKYEFSYLISQRAMAIESGSPLMIPDTDFIHSIDIAREETIKGLNPIIIQRILPNGNMEEWKCIELISPFIENIDNEFLNKFMN
jgi:DNA-directed RNA polymerase subunit K/omega